MDWCNHFFNDFSPGYYLHNVLALFTRRLTSSGRQMRELTLETNLNGNLTKLFANMTRVWSCMTFSGVLCHPRIITGHHGPGTGGLLSQTMTSLKKKKSEKETIPLTTNSRLQLIKRQRRQLRSIEMPTIFAEFLFNCILIRIFSQRIQKH